MSIAQQKAQVLDTLIANLQAGAKIRGRKAHFVDSTHPGEEEE